MLSVGGIEVCRYSWTIGGLTVLSTHLYVELSAAAGVPFDRALALVMAPILEQRARLASEWNA